MQSPILFANNTETYTENQMQSRLNGIAIYLVGGILPDLTGDKPIPLHSYTTWLDVLKMILEQT